MSRKSPLYLALLTALLSACSPALNWREARIDGTALRVLLPCKPDRAEREVAMGGRTLPLRMLGCDADGATFAVSHVRTTADATEAAALLAGWKLAVLAHVHADAVVEETWSPGAALAAAGPASRMRAQGRRADGAAIAMQAVWFLVTDAAGLHLLHAVVFAPQARPEVAETFFSSFVPAP